MNTRTLVVPIAFAGAAFFSTSPEAASAANEPVVAAHNPLLAELDTVVGVVAMRTTGPAHTQAGSSALCRGARSTNCGTLKANLAKPQTTTASLGSGKSLQNGRTNLKLRAGKRVDPKTTAESKLR